MLSVSQTPQRRIVRRLVNNKLETNRKVSGSGLIQALSRNLTGGLAENHEKSLVRIEGVPGAVRTGHLTNTNLEPYR
jgi:hypothetical protein